MNELANTINTGPRLDLVVMPLVRVMAEGDLTWAARVRVADAIQVCINAWGAMEEERWMFAQKAAGTERVRPCTCHPDDNPPRPCPRKYALAQCRAAANESEVRK